MGVAEMENARDEALAFGFSHAGVLQAATLTVLDEVRDMCAADKCRQFGKSWVCPPACGSIAENAKRLEKYARGIVVQTTTQLEDEFDIEGMEEASRRQKELFNGFRQQLKARFPGLLPLSSSGCTLCEECTYPGAPCRHPEDTAPSMEAFGLWVSDVCKKNGLEYYYGPNTMTYTACYLLE